MTDLERYYNKFDEDHRLKTRHGQVEFTTSMKYIHDAVNTVKKQRGLEDTSSTNGEIRILDIGAATGAYSVPLSEEGFSVTAVELVERNLKALESKHAHVNCWPGNALDLHFLDDETFDVTLIFGPLYHLHTEEEMLTALSEAKRVTKKGGIILAAYVMNEYAVLTYCFRQQHIQEVLERGALTDDFHTVASEKELYTYLRLEDINRLAEKSGLSRLKIIAADGAADYLRRELNALSEEEFKSFIAFHLATCERSELLGASSHLVDILQKKD